MISTTYKGRTIAVDDETRGNAEAGTRTRRMVVNDIPQFGYPASTDPETILSDARRYIDAYEAAEDKAEHLAAAGVYVPTRDSDFSSSWRAAA